MKRVWLIGSNGKIGDRFLTHLNALEYEIFPTELDDVDITNEADVLDFVRLNRPDFIINCSGYGDAALCEQNPDTAYKINAIGARNIAIAAESIGARMVQLSTDDVFDGKSTTPYSEFDPVVPVSVYGKSKYAGEQFVRSMTNRYLIIRSSWVYGFEGDIVDRVLALAKDGKRLEIPDNSVASPTSVDVLAETTLKLMEESQYGTFHITCKGHCTRFEFVQEILKKKMIDGAELVPVTLDEDQSVRSLYTVLDNMMLRITEMPEAKDWKTVLNDYLMGEELDHE